MNCKKIFLPFIFGQKNELTKNDSEFLPTLLITKLFREFILVGRNNDWNQQERAWKKNRS